jgi:hypothetical protein
MTWLALTRHAIEIIFFGVGISLCIVVLRIAIRESRES